MVVDFRLVAKLLSPALFLFGVVATIPFFFAALTETDGQSSFLFAAALSLLLGIIFRLIGKDGYTCIIFMRAKNDSPIVIGFLS